MRHIIAAIGLTLFCASLAHAFEIEEECLLKEVSRAFSITDDEFLLMDNWVKRLMALEDEVQTLM